MTDAKEWVTIKIPKEVRDRASGLDATYEEIMKAGCAAFEESKEPIGNLEPFGGKVPSMEQPDLEPVLNRLDDLQAQLPKDVATELER